MRRTAGIVCAIAGVFLITQSLLHSLRYRSFQASTSTQFINKAKYLEVTNLRRIAGQLQIPRLHMSVTVLEGDDDESLSLAAGRLHDSAAFGALGNVVVAGHRDTSFWPLRHVRSGDHIRIRTTEEYDYIVERTTIVKPDDISPLQPTADATLTLITCYPFRFVGDAPERFVVRAKLLSDTK